MALRPDSWLSSMLGKPAWHLDTASSVALETPLPVDSPCFVDARLPVSEIEHVAALQSRGFRLIDTGIVLDRPVVRSSRAIRARFAEPDDRVAIERIAAQSFRYSRFHQDPLVQDSVANRIKRAWVGNFFDGARGDHMVVAQDEGQVVGFLQLLQSDSLLTIDLVAVSATAQGKGLARDMIHFAENNLSDVDFLRVGTQAVNVRSLRAYAANGFRHHSANYVLHYHG